MILHVLLQGQVWGLGCWVHTSDMAMAEVWGTSHQSWQTWQAPTRTSTIWVPWRVMRVQPGAFYTWHVCPAPGLVPIGAEHGWTFFFCSQNAMHMARFACKEPGVDAPFVGAASQCDSRGWWECIASAQYCECSWESRLVSRINTSHLGLSVASACRVHILLLIFIFPMKLAMFPSVSLC